MIDGSEKRNRQLAFELQNSHVCEKRIKCYVIHNLHLRLYLPHVLLLVQANQIVLLVLHRPAILS